MLNLRQFDRAENTTVALTTQPVVFQHGESRSTENSRFLGNIGEDLDFGDSAQESLYDRGGNLADEIRDYS